MSAIASFYVVPGERLTDIFAVATPAPGGWFRPARDTFWGVLRGAGRELETFAWSGWVFNTLDLYLESQHGLIYGKFSDDAASRQLSKARGSDWLVLPSASAAELLAALRRRRLRNRRSDSLCHERSAALTARRKRRWQWKRR
jgi:hypothetical protein